MSEVLKNPYVAAELSGLGMAAAVVGGITVLAHRKFSHESLELSPTAEALAYIALFSSGTVPEVWSDVHTGPHHQVRDANLVPIIDTGDYLAWRDEHQDITYPPIPETFTNLDRAAVLNTHEVKQVRTLAREIKTRRGDIIKDLYVQPDNYSLEEAKRLLDVDTRRYLYEKKPSVEELNPDGLASIAHLLRDPHSPSLHRHGFFGVALGGIGLYRRPARIFARQRDTTNDYDTSTWYKSLNVNYRKWGPASLFAASIGGRLVHKTVRGNLTAKTAKTAVATGALSAGTALTLLLAGSNAVNSLGHIDTKYAKEVYRQRGFRGLFEELLNPTHKADGTYTNNADGIVISIVTQDEAARQEHHHLEPGAIAFTDKKGLEQFKDAPYGSSLEFSANHKLFGMRLGSQYGERDNPEGFDHTSRPDMPAEAVLLLEGLRVITREKQIKLGLSKLV